MCASRDLRNSEAVCRDSAQLTVKTQRVPIWTSLLCWMIRCLKQRTTVVKNGLALHFSAPAPHADREDVDATVAKNGFAVSFAEVFSVSLRALATVGLRSKSCSTYIQTSGVR